MDMLTSYISRYQKEAVFTAKLMIKQWIQMDSGMVAFSPIKMLMTGGRLIIGLIPRRNSMYGNVRQLSFKMKESHVGQQRC